MAGSLYLGSQRVCPAIVSGGGEPQPIDYCTYILPDNLTELNGGYFASVSGFLIDSSNNKLPFVLDLNNLEYIRTYAFGSEVNNIQTGVGLKAKKLKEVSAMQGISNCFNNVVFINGYTDVVFDSLETLSYMYAIANCFQSSNITSIRFPKLVNLSNSCLYKCGIKDGLPMYFNSLKSTSFQNGNELNGIAGETTGKILHFPSNLSSVIPEQDGYPDFGGTDTVILYDLPATE